MSETTTAAVAEAADNELQLLLLEDSPRDAELLIDSLGLAQPRWRIEWTRNESEFLAALERGGFDLVLSDYELPGFSGVEALEQALRRRPGTPFVFVSGVIGEENAVEMLRRGATDYVLKERMGRLPMVIERAMREVRQERQRKLAERQLREADALYARVVDSLKDYAVILLDVQGQIRAWNAAASLIFGYAVDEVLGRSCELLLTPEDRAAGVLQAEMHTAAADGSASDDRWLLHKDGRRLWAEGVMTPLYSDGAAEPSGYSKIVRDATEAHEAASAVRRAKEEAERANRAKDRFLAVLSHELRTPLAPITAATFVLQRVAKVPPECEDLLPMIRRNVALEARLIDDLLDMTAIEEGKLHLKLQPLDVHRVVPTVIEMLGNDIQAKGLRLQLELQAQDTVVQGDEARLQQVVWNIVRNAVKFTPDGGSIRLRSYNDEAGRLCLECTDSGIGIAPESLSRIFVAFEQADQEVAEQFGGLGLGLTIARSLVARHGGSLEAHSDGRHQGATFRILLPTGTAATRPAGTPAAATPAPSPSAPLRHRLLLVEDHEDAAQVMKLLLEDLDYEVTLARSLQEALECGRSDRFDLIITDLGLPGGSGVEVARAFAPGVPVVALSGYGSEEDLRSTRAAGFASHLIKPVDPEQLQTTLRSLLRHPPTRR
ncbi:response regulator [Caldimonas brevitalea]|uniref:histidine kinase n=1 Tax=Caldimonas brevitalea TaxID=413882 RepID=A0A0G3BRH0_9BURK|nr:response regulator [Caldimonas brevitalea]AKJ29145.1 PAS/PAC sensor hybrid histidine kinase [Caldimonas brevitalea]